MQSTILSPVKKQGRVLKFVKQNWAGYAFISPIMLGIIIFTLYPMLTSMYYSFHDYNVLTPATNFGVQNYIAAFTTESYNFFLAVKNTLIFTLITLPLGMILSYLLAILLNRTVPFVGFFRVVYYIPIIIPGIVMSLIWLDIFDFDYGLINSWLISLEMEPYGFFDDFDTALRTFIAISFFGIGGNMVLWLAQLKSIPLSMYEAADIEGANSLTKLVKITIPMSTSMIFYMIILGIIGCLQVFGTALMLDRNGALLFYISNIYNEAFSRFHMGYASALSWILFAAIALLSAITFKTSRWVYYGE